MSCEAHQRQLRERLCRYIARPAVAEQRLTVNTQGKVVYLLKTPYRVNLTRYHGVLAPNHRWRAEVTPSGRGFILLIHRLFISLTP